MGHSGQTVVRAIQPNTDFLGQRIAATATAFSHFPAKISANLQATLHHEGDPVWRQFVPDERENLSGPEYTHDPLAELHAQLAPGLFQKYHGRALLIVTAACPVHCRYCFRRHFAYTQHRIFSDTRWLEVLRQRPGICEIILSGGDPLMACDDKLQWLLEQLATIPHIQRVRIHTRMPVAEPQRITPQLLALLTGSRLRTLIVVHVNHAQELNVPAQKALSTLHGAGISLLNQSVLLHAVNDHGPTLVRLSEQLFETHVLPYYLHQLDKVAGAEHFAVSDAQALALMRYLRQQLPGYLVPRLVREQPAMSHKTPITE